MTGNNSKTGHSVIVRIFGEDYPIAGYTDPAYISRVADIVDARMREVAEQSGIKARDKVAILTALSLASELCEKQERLQFAEQGDSERLESLISRIEQTLSQ
ncbi:MAG: cell division protein ZapA [Candidatus Zixiibacteriota bacterium]|nr:MAG: cell division protein ZapA [candidate division Zixibacteria bacterium]